jgi:hypothetical protein
VLKTTLLHFRDMFHLDGIGFCPFIKSRKKEDFVGPLKQMLCSRSPESKASRATFASRYLAAENLSESLRQTHFQEKGAMASHRGPKLALLKINVPSFFFYVCKGKKIWFNYQVVREKRNVPQRPPSPHSPISP